MDDNKTIGTIAVATIIGIFGLYAIQYLIQAFAPAVEEPVEYPEPYGMIWLSPMGHIMNVDYGAGEQPVYFGEAFPGTANDEAGWRIYRYEYSLIVGDLEIVGIRFAGGDTAFDKVWDNREDYEYS